MLTRIFLTEFPPKQYFDVASLRGLVWGFVFGPFNGATDEYVSKKPFR